MVVWVFAGGGESELGKRKKSYSPAESGGLINFLKQTFPHCTFERKTPIRWKPAGKPKPNTSYGKTDISLINQIKEQLSRSLKDQPDQCTLILIFDDLDCRNAIQQQEKFEQAVHEILNESTPADTIPIFVAFASPELESWLIADWNNSIAQHTDFRNRHKTMQHWLTSKCNIAFDDPENFSQYDKTKDSCQEKLSDLLIESTKRADRSNINQVPFSKKEHTPLLLLNLDPHIVQKKCPLFREFYEFFKQFCQPN